MTTLVKTLLAVIFLVTFSASQLTAQCDNMRPYNGLIATIAKDAIVGQTFLISEDCLDGSAFSTFEISHQAKWETNITLKIYEGQSVKSSNLVYTQENIIVPNSDEKGNNFVIKLEGGKGKLAAKSCSMYTVTLQPTNNQFRWNGEPNDKAQPGIAYWPNKGGMFVHNGFDYLYKVTFTNKDKATSTKTQKN